ncbi:hypothetical protein ACOSQ2_024926 [Xanthoceras sorbifolium]
MADGAVVDIEDDYDFDDPSRTIGELIWRLRLCFRDSDLAKAESVLTARENKMKEEIGTCDRANQRLKNELKIMERDKRKAESEAERWMTKYRLLESRLSKLEADAELLKSKNLGVRVSGGNGENVGVEAYVDSAAARNVGLAPDGSGRTPTRCIVEIIDSDDEFASGGNLIGKKSTSQRVANTAHLDQKSLQNGTEMRKRKHDSSLSVSENENNAGAIVGNTLTGDCNRNKLQKVIHVHDGSPNNHGSATDNKVETYFTPSSHFPVTLRQCEEKMGAEHAARNLMSEFLSNVCGGCDDEDSSSSSCSSSDSDDDVNINFDFSQLISQQYDKKWEDEIDVFVSLRKDDELCLKAVCALYRQQTSLGTSPRNLSSSSSRGFNHLDVLRGTTLAKFLIDGNPQGMLKKSVPELLQFDRNGLGDCRRIASNHSKQILEIYKKKEDPLFLP